MKRDQHESRMELRNHHKVNVNKKMEEAGRIDHKYPIFVPELRATVYLNDPSEEAAYRERIKHRGNGRFNKPIL